MRLKKSSPPIADNPRLTFASQRDVMTLARLLAEHRGHHKDEHRFHGLIYSLLIYDHYATAYNLSQGGNDRIGDSWVSLAQNPVVNELFIRMLPWTDQDRLETLSFNLPIQSASPLSRSVAPANITPGQYSLGQLTAAQFAEIAWKVRCNLLHGSYDPSDHETWLILRNVARPLMCLVWQMLKETPR